MTGQAPERATTYLFSVAFWLLFLLTSPFALLGAVLVTLVNARRDPERNRVHAWVCGYMFGLLRLNPLWDVRVEGRERLPPPPCVLVANHQSMADILAACGLRYPFKFVSKASLFWLPLVGWAMRLCRYIPLERGRPKSTARMVEAARGWLRRGVAVLIFPEGTYAPGPELLPFRRGAFRLAIEEKVPVVPVALSGTSELIREDGPWLRPRAKVRIRILEPILAAGSDEDVLIDQVRVALSSARALP